MKQEHYEMTCHQKYSLQQVFKRWIHLRTPDWDQESGVAVGLLNASQKITLSQCEGVPHAACHAVNIEVVFAVFYRSVYVLLDRSPEAHGDITFTHGAVG